MSTAAVATPAPASAAILAALDRLVADGPVWEYAEVDGYVSPVPDPRPTLGDLLSDETPRRTDR